MCRGNPCATAPRGRFRTAALVLLLASAASLAACSAGRRIDKGPFADPVITSRGTEIGLASWYGPGFHGKTTANGERYDQHGLTAAHRSLPFGTRVEVTDLTTDRRVVVRINDRGPFIHGRVIDLSRGAAARLGMIERGTATVELRVLQGS